MGSSVWQCVVVCCSVLQYGAMCCSVKFVKRLNARNNRTQSKMDVCCSVLQCLSVRDKVCCSAL